MNALNIDTLKFARSLKAAGADDRLAEAIAEGVAGADTSQFATKSDIAELRSEVVSLRADMKAERVEDRESVQREFASVQTQFASVREEFASVRTEFASVRTEMAAMKSELVRMNWITSIGIIAAMFTMLRFFD